MKKLDFVKFIVGILLFCVGIYGSNWVFNHISPWLGIIAFVIVGVLTVVKLWEPVINLVNKLKN